MYIFTYLHTDRQIDINTRAYLVFDPSRSFKVNRLAPGSLIPRQYQFIRTGLIAGRLRRFSREVPR